MWRPDAEESSPASCRLPSMSQAGPHGKDGGRKILAAEPKSSHPILTTTRRGDLEYPRRWLGGPALAGKLGLAVVVNDNKAMLGSKRPSSRAFSQLLRQR